MMEDEDKRIMKILPYIILFSFFSIFFITLALVQFGITNDFLFFELQGVADNLSASGVIGSEQANITQSMFENYQDIPSHLDYLWFGIYLVFFISTIMYSYLARRQNYLGVFSMFFYGFLFLLFVLSLVVIITDWWQTNILLAMIPNALYSVPIFSFYLSNIGVITLLHLVLCYVVNIMDIDISKMDLRKKKEQKAFEDNEVL